jgi:hypothetical protein
LIAQDFSDSEWIDPQNKTGYNPRMAIDDNSILEAALIGLQHQHDDYTAKIAEIRRTLGIRAPLTTTETGMKTAAPARRKMSAAARSRIGEATRKRWAAYRAKKAAAAKKAEKPVAKKAAPPVRKKKTAVKKVATKKAT